MYDLIIIGAGAAGCSASIYASRYRLNHLIFGKIPGGQIMDATTVENYPAYISISGAELVQKFVEHVKSYKVEIKEEKVGAVKKISEGFELTTEKGEKIETKTLILAMGARHRALNVHGEEKFMGKGVSYCYNCDATLFNGKEVAVVGGGDSAATASLH